MSRVWHIAAKELLQTRRDRLAALFSIVLPVVFTVFLGLLIGGFGGDGSLPLAIADLDGGTAAQELMTALEAEPVLALQTVEPSAVERAVRDQEAAAGLVIPAGYGAAVAAGEPARLTFVRVETSSGAQSVYQAVQAVISKANATALAADVALQQIGAEIGRPIDEDSVESARARAATALETSVLQVDMVSSGATSRELGGFDQASTGSLVNWTLFGLLTVATGLAWERRQGLLRRMVVAGASAPQIIGGKMLGMIILTFLQQLLLVLLGQFAFGVDYFASPAALALVMLSLSVLASSLGLLISSVFRSEQAVIATTVISAQLLAALAGAWFPLEITSAGFSRAAHILPTAWVVDSCTASS
jgi:ABC-2 type transport system permease protein